MKPGDRALRLRETLLKTGHGKTAWYREVAAGRAPKPIRIGLRASAWLESELDDYLATLARERDDQPTAVA